MSLSPAFLDELRARTHLSALIGKTTKLTKAGREFRGCCPFHNEKTPSFYVNDEKGFYHCFGCSANGDAIKWMTDQRGLPFIDAVKELAQSAGLEMPAQDPRAAKKAERAKGLVEACEDAAGWYVQQLAGLAGAEARAVLAKRGIKPETAKAFGLGFAPDSRGRLRADLKDYGDALLVEAGLLIQVENKEPYDRFRGRLMIPIRDQRGRAIAFGGRIIGAKGDKGGEPKYLNSPETPLFDKGRTLFNLDRASPAARKANRVLVVEGYMDVIALAQAGFGEAVAPLGTALTEAQLERLWRLSDVPILCFDGDAAGQKAAIRAAHRALPLLQPGKSLSFVTLPDGQDPDDLVRAQGAGAFEALLAQAQPLVDRLWQAELAATPVMRTPEERTALGVRLRALAGQITDQHLRTDYLATFNRMVWDYFHPERTTDTFRRFKSEAPRRTISDRLHSIAKFGIDQVTMVPAALKGLMLHPSLIAPLAERIGDLPINSTALRIAREALLRTALVCPDLETAEVCAILHKEGRKDVLIQMEKLTLAFSFLDPQCERTVAEKELTLVIDALVAGPELQGAIDAAQTRRQDWSDADFVQYVRLVETKRETDQVFMDTLLAEREAADAANEGN